MRTLALAITLLLAPSLALADGDAPKPTDPPPAAAAPAPAPVAPKLLDGTPKPKDIAAKETHRDADHLGGRECAPNAMGVVECKVPVPEPRQPIQQPTTTRASW